MTWSEIPGWFDFHDVYDEIVSEAPPRSILVELGCWLGRSVCYLGMVADAAGKDLKIYAVDHWRGTESDGLAKLAADYAHAGKTIHQRFLDNVAACGLSHMITPIRGDGADVAADFADESVFAAFIDAEHTTEAVARDIRAWRPKVMIGGYLAGHDINIGGVERAVDDAFPGAWHHRGCSGMCWRVRKTPVAPETPVA